jgi:hypothetical protein
VKNFNLARSTSEIQGVSQCVKVVTNKNIELKHMTVRIGLHLLWVQDHKIVTALVTNRQKVSCDIDVVEVTVIDCHSESD